MYKLIIFDLDGVLVDAKRIHFETLNHALGEFSEKFIISEIEHFTMFDGLKTYQKLELLTKTKGLPLEKYNEIWQRKQNLTFEQIKKLNFDKELVDLFKYLNQAGYKLACCSNSIRRSVFLMLSRIGLIEYMDLIISNEDVINCKPHPEMYWKAMSILHCLPEETMIVEDSPVGLLAASRSNASVFRVNSPKDLTLEKIKYKLSETVEIKKPKWQHENMNILIPMAGAGSRFQLAGYTFPKPLIEVNGRPMIQVVVDNLNIDANYIYVVQKEHNIKYNLKSLLNLLTPNCDVIEIDGISDGAACTTLLAKSLINSDMPLIIANSDQFIDWDSNEFMYKMIEQNVDGGIVTFNATHPKWSFAKVNELGFVTEVAEKNPISNRATVGIYFWAKGSDYVKYAEEMIKMNHRINNEFYVCPVFNFAIKDGKKIKEFQVEKMWGLGTPEDLSFYLETFNK